MNITTKHNVGEELFFMSTKTNKIERYPVYKIEITVGDISFSNPDRVKVYYFFYISNLHVEMVTEELCFVTKQDLIDTL